MAREGQGYPCGRHDMMMMMTFMLKTINPHMLIYIYGKVFSSINHTEINKPFQQTILFCRPIWVPSIVQIELLNHLTMRKQMTNINLNC